MHIDFSGRVVVVTGGANGIGRSAATMFAQFGAHVAIWDVDGASADRHAQALRAEGRSALGLGVNVTERASVDAAASETAARFGGIDVLINNAGIIRDAQTAKVKDGAVVGGMTEADFDAVIDVNLKGVFVCTQAVIPYLLARGGGRIVNASSVVARTGNFGQANYVASKAGVVGLTQVWARELGRRGITVNAVAPGFIATDMTARMPPTVLEHMTARTPSGRLGKPDDVAAAYCFLASDAAGFINGTVLAVDGGLVIGT